MTRRMLAPGLIAGMSCAVGLISGYIGHGLTSDTPSLPTPQESARLSKDSIEDGAVRTVSRLSPQESAHLWNDSLTNGDVETARKLTSRSSDKYIQAAFGSIEDLSRKYQNATWEEVQTTSIHSEISGARAVVIYRCQYNNGAIKYWMDTLFLEDNMWKLAPQYVKMSLLKNAEAPQRTW